MAGYAVQGLEVAKRHQTRGGLRAWYPSTTLQRRVRRQFLVTVRHEELRPVKRHALEVTGP